jgi:hypothetical protein
MDKENSSWVNKITEILNEKERIKKKSLPSQDKTKDEGNNT